MSENQRAPQQDQVELAMSYLAEVANTYSQTLDPVARGPFVNHVNGVFRLVKEDRERLQAAVAEQPAQVPEPIADEE